MIPVERPADSALIHGISGSLLQMEGKTTEAIAEALTAASDWERAGRGDAVETAGALTLLGLLYVQTSDWAKAQEALERAAGIVNRSKETATMDRIKLQFVLGVMSKRRREWVKAEREFAEAIAIADRQGHVDSTILRSLLITYASVLRKQHRTVEARAIETRAAALGSGLAAIVDLSELSAKSTSKK